MGTSAIATSLGKLINNSAKLLGNLQVGVNKLLWGSTNTQPIQTVSYNTASNSLTYNSQATQGQVHKNSLLNNGLYGSLDALNSVNLCSVLTYATDTINVKRRQRPEKPWTAPQTTLYTLQDQAAIVQNAIDKYIAYPNIFIGSYLGTGANAVPQNIAISQSNAPTQGGTEVQKYNLYFLMVAIKNTFSLESTGSIFTAQDKILIATVPGLGGNLNIIDDFIGIVNKYSDYRQIPTTDLQKLQNKITTLRSVCVTIQNLDFKNTLALVGNFLGTDIRAQIQELSKFIDVTKIIPTLKQINSSILAFIRIGKQVQGVLSTGQFLIKLALLFYKIFKFITKFFTALAIPLIFSTAGAQTTIQDLKDKAKDETDGINRLLKGLNALLAIVVEFIRYLLTNANELLIRLDILLTQLKGCAAVQDSDVVKELQQTRAVLQTYRDELASYITTYDSKTSPNTALFGAYSIKVVDEEVTDPAIQNKRRRGIALDQNGNIVTQSDLTFATNTTVIIDEVKQKLIALRLIQPNLGQTDFISLATISDSLTYLDNEDILQNDLNITATQLDSPENLDENRGLGLNAFINNLKGGKKLRKRTQAAVAAQTANVKTQIATEANTSKQALKTTS